MKLVSFQIPGGVELLIITIVFLVLVAIGMAFVVGILYLGRRTRNRQTHDEQRIRELEQRVEVLEEKNEP